MGQIPAKHFHGLLDSKLLCLTNASALVRALLFPAAVIIKLGSSYLHLRNYTKLNVRRLISNINTGHGNNRRRYCNCNGHLPAEPAEAGVAETGAAELALCAGLTCGRLGGSDALGTWTHHFWSLCNVDTLGCAPIFKILNNIGPFVSNAGTGPSAQRDGEAVPVLSAGTARCV